MVDEQNVNNSLSIPPILRSNFLQLLGPGKLSIIPLKHTDITKCIHHGTLDDFYNYNYSIKIPFAGRKLNWEVIFNPDNIEFAPDFNFNDDSFALTQSMNAIVKNIPSLVNWDVSNQNSLTQVLREFIALYQTQNERKLFVESTYSHISSQYKALLAEDLLKDYTEEDIEFYIDNFDVYFLIRLKLNLIDLPPYQQVNPNLIVNPGEDACYIKLYLQVPRDKNSKSNRLAKATVQLSKRVEQLVDEEDFHIPTYTNNKSISSYVRQVSDSLIVRLERVRSAFVMRKSLMLLFKNHFKKNIVEIDTEMFTYGTFLISREDVHFFLRILTNSHYPMQKPNVELVVIECFCSEDKCSIPCEFICYDHWGYVEMFLSILHALKIVTIPKLIAKHQKLLKSIEAKSKSNLQ